jgi:GNAT superfamily N-acetyltransferase
MGFGDLSGRLFDPTVIGGDCRGPRMNGVTIERVHHLIREEFDGLVTESEATGLQFVTRLVDEWESGANRFDRPGEALFVARLDSCRLGVCGLNADPYSARPDVGRVRHLYVLAPHRRQGVGGSLLRRVVEEAAKSFSTLTLRTNTAEAAAFYEAAGFSPTVTLPSSTHRLNLSR